MSTLKTPWNPSKRATARVKNPLPAPTECPFCKSKVEICNNKLLYGREYGEWPWTYRCLDSKCRSYVGMHPFTNIPLGALANGELRQLRVQAKSLFNPIWQTEKMTRDEAYATLAKVLNLPKEECHFGWFDTDTCKKVIDVLKYDLKNFLSSKEK